MADKKEGMFTEGKKEQISKNNRGYKLFRQDSDGFYKYVFSTNKEERTKFLKEYLSKDVLAQIDVAELDLAKDSYIDVEYKRRYSDLVFVNKNKDKYLYLLFEHQSQSDDKIAFRLWEYSIRLLDAYQKEYPKRKFPLIYQMVIYNGQNKYSAPLSLWDLFEKPELQKQYFDRGYQLVDLQAKSEQELVEKRRWIDLFAKYLVKRKIREIASAMEKPLLEVYNRMQEMGIKKIDISDGNSLREIINYVINIVPEEERVEVHNIVKKYDEEFMRTIAQAWLDEGKQEGIQEGIQQEQKQIAKNMLSEGMDLSTISRITGLSISEINTLK